LFDLEIQNSGGRRYIRDVAIRPYKERPYEPSQYDPSSGLSTTAFLRPSYSIIYDSRNGTMPVFDVRADIFMQTDNTAPGSTLPISVVDFLGRPIDVRKFEER